MHLLEYFSQYDSLFTMEWQEKTSFSVPYIWQCWLQGTQALPPLAKACIRSVQVHCADKKIKFLDQTIVGNFIKIPVHIQEKYQKGLICPAHFTDYIRVALLAKYGGTWIDATVLVTAKLPQDFFSQTFFAYCFPPWCEHAHMPKKEHIFSEQTRPIDRRCFSNWFMHAQQNSRFMHIIKGFLETYWLRENVAFDYFFFHLFCTYAVLKDAYCAKLFQAMPKQSNAYAHLLQQCLLHPFDAATFENIQKLSPLHKLTHKMEEKVAQDSFGYFLGNAD